MSGILKTVIFLKVRLSSFGVIFPRAASVATSATQSTDVKGKKINPFTYNGINQ